MEDCQRCQELLGLYMDSMLEGEELSFVESHLLQCKSCKKEAQELKELLSLLPELEQEPPDDFKQGWRKAIREQKKPKKNYIAAISLLAAGAAIVFLSTKMLPSIINPQLPAPSEQAKAIIEENFDAKEAILSEQDESAEPIPKKIDALPELIADEDGFLNNGRVADLDQGGGEEAMPGSAPQAFFAPQPAAGPMMDENQPALFSTQPQIDAVENQDEVMIQNDTNEILEAIIADDTTATEQQTAPFIASAKRSANIYVSEMSIYVSSEDTTAAKEILKELINQLSIGDVMLEKQANELSRLLEEKGYKSAFTLASDPPERIRYFITNKKVK